MPFPAPLARLIFLVLAHNALALPFPGDGIYYTSEGTHVEMFNSGENCKTQQTGPLSISIGNSYVDESCEKKDQKSISDSQETAFKQVSSILTSLGLF